MQAQVPPQAEATVLGDPQQQAGPEHLAGATEQADHGHKKSSVIGKVKNKAKKLKTKIKKPKSPGAAGENDESSSCSSSNEEENGIDHQQQLSDQTGEERDMVVQPGLKGEALEAIPDPHVDTAGGMHERFGQLRLGDEPDRKKLQEEVPSAPGQVSAGISPYIASHNIGESIEAGRGIPVEEGKNPEGKDLVVPPAADDKGVGSMDYEQSSDMSKTSDNTAAWYTPTSAENATDAEQQKPFKDRIVEGAAATKDTVAATAASSGAAGTVASLKDTIASKLGYGSNKNLTRESDAPVETTPNTTQVDTQNLENKSVLQKIQERAAGATAAVTSKLGYGDKQSPSGDKSPSEVVPDEVNPDNKSYTQKAREAAYGAKDAVVAKLGYGGTSTKDDVSPAAEGDSKSYLQKAQETALGAKDTVASKLGYANRDVPTAASESAYTEEQNVPTTTAARFHPGEEDRALSQLITETMSSGAATVKDTLFKPFGSKSGPPTPTTTPPPSSAAAIEADPGRSTVSETKPDVPHEEKPGIVGKVTGAVSSLLTSASGKKKVDEASGKAMEDPQAQAAGKATDDPQAQAAGVCNVEMH